MSEQVQPQQLLHGKRITRLPLLIGVSILITVLFFIAGFFFSQPRKTDALSSISPVMEFLIAKGEWGREWIENNPMPVLITIASSMALLYLSWFIVRKRRPFPGMMTLALLIAVGAIYLVYNEFPEFGFVCFIWAGLVAFLHLRLPSVEYHWDNRLEYKPSHYVAIAALFVIAFVSHFYRIDTWVTDNFRWSDPNFYEIHEMMLGNLNPWKHALLWGQQRETTSSECIFYIGIIISFIKIFGFRILTFRLLSAAVGIIGLAFNYLIISRFYGRRLAFMSTAFMACSGWYLLYARSETYVIFMIPVTTITFYAFLQGLLNGKRWGYFGAGIGMGLMPYFYSVIRILPFFLIAYMLTRWFLFIVWFRKAESFWQRVRSSSKVNLIPIPLMLLGALVFVAPQLTNIPNIGTMYFSGRGEQVINMTRHPHIMKMLLNDPTAEPPYPMSLRIKVGAGVMWQNVINILRDFFGLRPSKVSTEYEKALISSSAIFMLLGLFLTLSRWREERYFFMLWWMFFSIILTLGANLITSGRIFLGISPISFFIAFAFEQVWAEWERLLGKFRIAASAIFVPAFLGLLVAELTLFYPVKGEHEFKTQSRAACEVIQEYLPNNTVVMVFPTWNFYADGFMTIWMNDWLKTQDTSKYIKYFMFSNFDILKKEINDGVYDNKRVVFLVENSNEEGALVAKDIVAMIKARWPETTSVLKTPWMKAFFVGQPPPPEVSAQ